MPRMIDGRHPVCAYRGDTTTIDGSVARKIRLCEVDVGVVALPYRREL